MTITSRLSELGLDVRFLLFVLLDAGFSILCLSVASAIWVGDFSVFFGGAMLGTVLAWFYFLLAGAPSAAAWCAIVAICRRIGVSLVTATMVAAPITPALASFGFYVLVGFAIGGERVDQDGLNVVGLLVAPFAVAAAPVVAWLIYRERPTRTVSSDCDGAFLGDDDVWLK